MVVIFPLYDSLSFIWIALNYIKQILRMIFNSDRSIMTDDILLSGKITKSMNLYKFSRMWLMKCLAKSRRFMAIEKIGVVIGKAIFTFRNL